jgi:serine/threonine protein kinase
MANTGYVVERLLGDDALGTAFLARGEVSGRPVVVKVLPDWLAADPAMCQRFRRATERALRLSHPNVVRLFDAGHDGHPFVVTDYVEGETLATRVSAGGRFDSSDSLRLATHLAAGLAHAHASGVVHGGLDTHTVLLGRDGVARLTDFGLALPVASAATAADDVYALGRILRQVGGRELPPGLTAIIDGALTPDANFRPSAVDMHHEVLTITGAPGLWLAPAVASDWRRESARP